MVFFEYELKFVDSFFTICYISTAIESSMSLFLKELLTIAGA